MEIRVIGTTEQLQRVAEKIKSEYEVKYQSGLYACRGSSEYRQYYKVAEKNDTTKNIGNG